MRGGVPRPPAGAVLLVVAVAAVSSIAIAGNEVRFGPRTAVPQRACQPDDRTETGLQGRVPPQDIATGRAAQGYTCNLALVGRFPSTAASALDSIGDCAYYAREAVGGGVQVLDVSDPKNPRPTEVLTSRAMLDPWESLRVNAKRKLLAADHEHQSHRYPYAALDVYDLASDCRHPRLVSSTDLRPAAGHEGWFAPDGTAYYMSTTGADGDPTVFPVDISDAARPRRLASWTFQSQTHGGSTTEDGTRSYICQQQSPPKDALLVVDTSEVAARREGAKPELLARVPLEDNQWCQGAYRVTYDGHPYLIQYGERSGAADCSRREDNWANFGYPRIYDLADERNPKLVSTALLEVHLPEHCSTVVNEGAANGLGYSVHHCSPDRLYDPTILACSWFHAGLRVLDIRDPRRPVEIGYFNPGVGAVVGTASRPVVRAERGEIWFTNDVGGFYVVRFKAGIWPFKDAAACPEYDDYYFAQYNPGSRCPTANFDGLGKPAPQAPRPPAAARTPACVPATSRVTRAGVGAFRIGRSKAELVRRFGTPGARRGARVLRWCVRGGGTVSVLLERGRVRLVATTARGHRAGSLRPGAARRGRGVRVRRAVVFAVRGGRVRYVGVADAALRRSPRALRRALAVVRP